MSGYLLDTHVLLWWLAEPDRLPTEVRDLIADPSHAVHLSAAAVWEMAIKKSIGRLDMPANLLEVLEQEHIEVLPINAAHALAAAELPLHHADPFDRMQIAQARLEGLTILTHDAAILKYDVSSRGF